MSSQTFEILDTYDDVVLVGTDADYATARATCNSDIYTYFYAGQKYASGTYTVYRECLRFDTSAIEDGSVIDSVTLRVCANNDYSVTDFLVEVVAASLLVPFISNREVNYDAILAETTVLGSYDTSLGIVPGTWYEIALTPGAYINTSGYTYLGVRSSRDKSATSPTGTEHVRFKDLAAGSSYSAELVVTWTPPAGATFKPPRAALGVGW